jgi:hypothetical protein
MLIFVIPLVHTKHFAKCFMWLSLPILTQTMRQVYHVHFTDKSGQHKEYKDKSLSYVAQLVSGRARI